MAPFKSARQSKTLTQALLEVDLSESSSDSDFRIEDHTSVTDDDNSDASQDASSSDDNSDDSSSTVAKGSNKPDICSEDSKTKDCFGDLTALVKKLDNNVSEVSTKPICCVCLGDKSDDSNEIVDCDGCGVSVHECCYGVNDNTSISSTNSTCSTEPWFCEVCRACKTDPTCELCPNKGGIFKETDVGKWVHLICALYIPGVAFGDVDQLLSVTLFEMQYSKWGAKVCSLCEDSRFARTGVCIGCDAGMCKTYFHVSCAQSAGFLMEAHHDENTDVADPFYAHCKVHSDKELMKKRKRNYHTLCLNMKRKQNQKVVLKNDDPCPAQMRIYHKLIKNQEKYYINKKMKVQPWVPTQKMSRLLTTSASACKRLLAKASTMSVDVELMERQESQISALTDIRKKWHIAPAFSVEFMGYFMDRISRTKEIKAQLSGMMDSNITLTKEQDSLRKYYDMQLDINKELKMKQESLNSYIAQLHKQINTMCPTKSLQNPTDSNQSQIEPKTTTPPARPISVPTAAALKMGVGFPLLHLGHPNSKADSTRLLSTHAKASPTDVESNSKPATPTLGVHNNVCGICNLSNDQHLLAKCDTCRKHYHLACLHPPLTRHPKKSKQYGWQCSECDKSDGSDLATDLPKGPRKARTRFNRDGSILFLLDAEKPHKSCKRRSEDVTTPSKSAKKSLEKSFDTSNEGSSNENSNAENCTLLSSPDAKRLNLSPYCVPAQNTNQSPSKANSPTKSLNIIKKNDTTTPIIHEHLETDEQLLLVMAASTPTSKLELRAPQSSDEGLIQMNAGTIMDGNVDTGKQLRKQKRKDKHRNKHNMSSDGEKSPNKERKHKRKKKVHDLDITNSPSNDLSTNVPKIKIKFKTLPLPGEEPPEAKFFYVPANMVRSAEVSRPSSVETIEEATVQPNIPEESVTTPVKSIEDPATAITETSPRKLSPRKTNPRSSSGAINKPSPVVQMLLCCICNESGAPKNLVICDQCKKNYHFCCLDPPLKKSPKIRGYSWVCGECDSTDEEKK